MSRHNQQDDTLPPGQAWQNFGSRSLNNKHISKIENMGKAKYCVFVNGDPPDFMINK